MPIAQCPTSPDLRAVKAGDRLIRRWGHPLQDLHTPVLVTRVTAQFIYARYHILLKGQPVECPATYRRKSGRQMGGCIPCWLTLK